MEDNKIAEDIQQPVELTAGEMLRNARTTGRRKREIPTIAKQLCIREEFLQALEEGNYTFIPELVYILGFARNYAMELGLNPDEIVNKIKHEMGVVSECNPFEDTDSCGGHSEKSKFDLKETAMHIWSFVVRKWYWFVGALVAIIVAVVAVVLLVGAKPENVDVVPETVVAEEVSTEPAFKMPVRERWGADNAKNSVVILQATRGSWIKVDDARGRTEFSRVLVEGDIYYVPAKGKYKATFGDAGGIDIWVNGELMAKAGADHVRKSDISLAADDLIGATKSADKAEKTEKSEKSEKADKSDKVEKTEKNDKADKSNKNSSGKSSDAAAKEEE